MHRTLRRRLFYLAIAMSVVAALGNRERSVFAIQRSGASVGASGQPGVPPPRGRSGRGDAAATRVMPPIDGVVARADGVFEITDPRPLNQIAVLLERKLGVAISYEDPVWASRRDTAYASALPANRELTARHPNWKGNLVPRGGTVTVVIPMAAEARQAASPASLIQAAISSYESSGNSAQFTVVRFGVNEFSIVPTRAEDKTGRLVDQVSPLDLKISFPEEDRSLPATIDLISRAIDVRPVRFDSSPDAYARAPRVRVGADNETAREVLARA